LKHICWLLAPVVVLACAPCGDVMAAPEEIQVYTDDINAPGEFGLEMHVNYVIDGFRTPEYPGQLPTNHVLQVTPEFSYGITRTWEAGLYLLSARSADGNLYGNGAKLRIKYIAPSSGSFFWGLNTELGYTQRRVTENYVNLELRPIMGWRGGPWLISFNPIVGAALSGDVSRVPTFEPALKIGRAIGEGTQSGIEYYADTGGIDHSPDFNQQNHVLYGVIDTKKDGIDLNFGVGHGITSASEKWVVKMIVGISIR